MNVYIPVEIKKRELESRLLLGLNAVKKGCRVIIGESSHVYSFILNEKCNPGLVHEKSITPTKSRIKKLRLAVDRGHYLTVQDEEHGLNRESYKYFSETRFSEESLSITDSVYCWGDHDYNCLTDKYKKYDYKFLNYGSPRVDMWRKEFDHYYDESDYEYINCGLKFKSDIGNYILIVSNFGSVLNVKPFWSIIEQLRNGGHLLNDNDEYLKYESVSWHYLLLCEFVKLIRSISKKLPDYKIIIRPHPVEEVDAWKLLIGELENVYIREEGSISSWIRNAQCIIQNGCTSAFESNVVKVPVIAYMPIRSEFERVVPNKVSIQSYSTDDCILKIINILSTSSGINEDSKEHIKERFSNINGDLSCELITDDWCKKLKNSGFKINKVNQLKAISIKEKIFKKITNIHKFKTNNRTKEYTLQKFPTLSEKEISSILSSLSKKYSFGGDIKYTKLTNKTILMYT